MQTVEIQGLQGPIQVSRLVLGTDYFGSGIPRDESFRILDAYVAAGGNMLDTARFYADWMPGGHGASERTLGEWLRERPGMRERVLIATKGGHPPLQDMHRSRLHLDEVRRDLDLSLQTLSVDSIDLYWLHRDDESQPVERIMDMLAAVAATGAVRALGVSNWRAQRILAANRYAAQHGLPKLCASQLQWSLAVSSAEAQEDDTRVVMDQAELACYQQQQFPVMAYTAQAKGFFSRPLEGPGAANDKSQRWFTNPVNLARRERVQQLAQRSGLSPTQIALGYVLSQPLPAMALIGPRQLPQLLDSLSAAEVLLSPADMLALVDGDA